MPILSVNKQSSLKVFLINFLPVFQLKMLEENQTLTSFARVRCNFFLKLENKI